MKKFTLAAFSLISFGAFAQAPVNGGFEMWADDTLFTTSDTIVAWNPVEWQSSNQKLIEFGAAANVTQETTVANVYSGTSSVKLSTLDLGFFKAAGALTNGTIIYQNNNFTFSGGEPYTSRPGSLTGWYKYTPVGVDSFKIYAFLTRWTGTSRETVASVTMHQKNAAATFAWFAAPFTYSSTENPDTLLIVALSSAGIISGGANSTLWLDDLNLEFAAGTEEISQQTLSVYPNPAANRLNIDAIPGQYATANVYDLAGRLVTVSKVNGNSIDVSALESGQYILELRNGNASARATFSKQ